MDVIVGIDLGTTNSEIAYVRDGQPHVFEEDGDALLPSVVGLSEDGKLLVGRAARNQYALAPERTIKSIKRQMGQDVTVPLGEKAYRPQEISALILRRLKERAEARLGHAVEKAVITVPAYFNDTQRQATREAGRLAGLDVVRIINEPTAASLTYEPKVEGLRRLLVYDLGGGTFDVSIVKAEAGVVEVLSSHGDTKLGGDDFDELLLEHLRDGFEAEHKIDLGKMPAARARLLRAAEDAKKELSSAPFARVQEEFIAEKEGRALHLEAEVSRDQYEEMIRPLLARTMECVQRALDDAHLTAPAIDEVILVGGSTRTPLVRRLLEERLDRVPRSEVNPDLCVALGAAIQGAIIAGQDVGAVLVDITPHSLGIRSTIRGMGFEFPHHMARIIARNTPLPANESEVFFTSYDGQREVDVEVFQGEDEDVRRNHRIGNVRVVGLADVERGNPIVVRLELSLDGTLQVSARERATGLQRQATMQNALADFVREGRPEAEARLHELWRETTAPPPAPPAPMPEEAPVAPAAPSTAREGVQARALMEKAERLLPSASEKDQEEVKRLAAALRTALEGGDHAAIASASGALADVLFYLEG